MMEHMECIGLKGVGGGVTVIQTLEFEQVFTVGVSKRGAPVHTQVQRHRCDVLSWQQNCQHSAIQLARSVLLCGGEQTP